MELPLKPISAAIAACHEPVPTKEGDHALIIVDPMSGLTAAGLCLALSRGDAVVETDGTIPLDECVRVVRIPADAELREESIVEP